jgi:hypothetical protein
MPLTLGRRAERSKTCCLSTQVPLSCMACCDSFFLSTGTQVRPTELALCARPVACEPGRRVHRRPPTRSTRFRHSAFQNREGDRCTRCAGLGRTPRSLQEGRVAHTRSMCEMGRSLNLALEAGGTRCLHMRSGALDTVPTRRTGDRRARDDLCRSDRRAVGKRFDFRVGASSCKSCRHICDRHKNYSRRNVGR